MKHLFWQFYSGLFIQSVSFTQLLLLSEDVLYYTSVLLHVDAEVPRESKSCISFSLTLNYFLKEELIEPKSDDLVERYNLFC